MVLFTKSSEGNLNHVKTWLITYAIGLLIFFIYDANHRLPYFFVSIAATWMFMQITLIPAMLLAYALTKKKIFTWIENHKLGFLIIVSFINVSLLSLLQIRAITVYANGYFYFKWEDFFEDFHEHFLFFLCPYLIYVLFITYKTSFRTKDKN
jgi:hypothetical protein